MENRARLAASGILLGALALPTSARAGIIFDNLGPGSSYDCCNGSNVGFGHFSRAMPFVVPAGPGYSLTQIDIALTFSFGTNAVHVELLNDASGLPGTSPLGQWTFTNLPAINTSNVIQAEQSATISPIVLMGGTQYWLAATADLPFTGIWNHNSISQIGISAFTDINGQWTTVADAAALGAFRLSGEPLHGSTIPEPASLFLFASGLCFIPLALRRRRK